MNFYEELANIFDEDIVTDETKFKQLDQWDSITLMTLQQSLQSNFGVKLSLKDIMTSETVADLKAKCNIK
ncbi:MAG: acyl carrier protein [Succinivibrio sp.]|nr:acyl carrier protein [Succinivibrio sp.]